MSETRKTALGLLALALAAFAFYLPALSGRFVFADDFAYFYYPQDPNWYLAALARCGRPLTGLYLWMCHGILARTGSPDLAHLPGLIGVLLLSLASFGWLRLWQVSVAPALLLCAVLLALPSTMLCVTYINCGSYGWAALLGALALLTFAPALRNPGLALRWKLLLGAAAWALLQAGMFTYQPTALYYWALAAVPLLCAPCPDWRTFRSRAAPLFGLGLAAMAGYFVTFKAWFWATGLTEPARGELASDLAGKLAWFWADPMNVALSLWSVPANQPRFARDVLLLALAGPAVDLLGLLGWKEKGGLSDHAAPGQGLRGRVSLALAKWLTAAALLPLSYGFHMILKECYAPYRTLLALEATTAVLLFAALARIASLLGARLRGPALSGALALGAATALFVGHANMMSLVILPRVAEFEYLKTCLMPFNPVEYRSIHVIRPDFTQGLAPAVAFEEFGTPSTCMGYCETMVRKALLDFQYPFPEPPITQSGPYETAPPPAGAFVIDMRRMVKLNPYWRRRP